MELFVNLTGEVAAKALDGLAARQRALSNNIANVETPGFQPGDVPFEAELRAARDRAKTDPVRWEGDLPLSLSTETQASESLRADGNGVNIDREVVKLSENTLTYEGLTRAMRMRGELMRAAISEGKK
jgi:flagellar basal-body rod protein FlgB